MNPDRSDLSRRSSEGAQADTIQVNEKDNTSGPGIAPQKPQSMPRAEDDEMTRANSPEFSDRAAAERVPHQRGDERHKDHSERRGASGDQDIDTAGTVPTEPV